MRLLVNENVAGAVIRTLRQAWMDLVLKAWWTRAHSRTDVQGRYRVRGFPGDYAIRAQAETRVAGWWRSPALRSGCFGSGGEPQAPQHRQDQKMRWDSKATVRASSDPPESAHSTGRQVPRRALLVACAMGAFVAGGCGSSRLAIIRDEATFSDQVLKGDRPVVVEFSKGGCLWCLFLDSSMDQLVGEYRDRVRFARFELVDAWGKIASETLWKRYRIGMYPTVILFVGGRERKRWVVDYNADNYRKVLDEATGPPTPKAVKGRL